MVSSHSRAIARNYVIPTVPPHIHAQSLTPRMMPVSVIMPVMRTGDPHAACFHQCGCEK